MNRLPRWIAVWLVAVMVLSPLARAQNSAEPAPFTKEEIEQMVAPLALYPDPLVAQILMASTYPLEVVQAARWSKEHPNLKDKALEDALQQQQWDPSVKSLTAFPQVIAKMSEKIDQTQRLGDAFLGQQKEVLDAIQRLRGRAEQAGNLKSGKEQTVTKAQEEGQTVIKIEPANPEIVYVPTYNPTVVYGPWPYPAYPPYAYYPPSYYPTGGLLLGFAVGVAVGNAMWGNTNWGGGNVSINNSTYNNFNRTNIKGGSGNWEHRPEHRKGTGYRDRGSQDRFGRGQRPGVDSRESFRGRAEQGRQDIRRDGIGDRGGVGDRGGIGDRSGVGDRGGIGDRGGMGDRGGVGDRGGAGDRGGFGDRGSQRGGGFQGMGNGAQTRDFSNRGAASRGGSAGSFGGGARGGGARGGGAAAGGGARGGGAAAGGGARGGGGRR